MYTCLRLSFRYKLPVTHRNQNILLVLLVVLFCASQENVFSQAPLPRQSVTVLPDSAEFKELTFAEHQQRSLRVISNAVRYLDSLDKRIQAKENPLSCVELSNAVLGQLTLHKDTEKAAVLLEKLLDLQNTDTRSADCGNFPSFINGKPNYKNYNVISVALPLTLIARTYFNRLPDQLAYRLKSRLPYLLAALHRTDIPISQTYLFLARSIDLILLGGIQDNLALTTEGQRNLWRWTMFTKENGISEFDSPLLYAQDLNALQLAFRFIKQDRFKNILRADLEYFWSDICANYFPGAGTLSGPHSIDYDLLGSNGPVENYLWCEGLRNAPSEGLSSDIILTALVESGEGFYHPPGSVLGISSVQRRSVHQRFSNTQASRRFNYVTADYAMGSTSGSYGPTDKLLNVEFATKKNLPPITLVAIDNFHELIPTAKNLPSSGHLPTHHYSVQMNGVLLDCVKVTPDGEKACTNVSTNIILPLQADSISINGKQVDCHKAIDLPIKENSLIKVVEGQVVLFIRVLETSGLGGAKPLLHFRINKDGLESKIGTLTIEHYRGAAKKFPNQTAESTLLIDMDKCPSKEDMDFLQEATRKAVLKKESDAQKWIYRVDVGDVAIGLRVWRGSEIVDHLILNSKRTYLPLSLNGADLAGPIWSTITK